MFFVHLEAQNCPAWIFLSQMNVRYTVRNKKLCILLKMKRFSDSTAILPITDAMDASRLVHRSSGGEKCVPDKGRWFLGKGKTSFHEKRSRTSASVYFPPLSAVALCEGGNPFQEKRSIL